ncbi:MAG TPA: GNAT family N-acetyltransferase [Polyangia bacterium]|jgi:Acetyltransferase (GNAT) family.|nr:GNAT family N-acetyltransferase [Polyangia bacterium]
MTESAVYSALDSARFGIRVFRAGLDNVQAVSQLVQFARSTDLDLLIVRCPVETIAAAQALERAGAFLTDTLVYYRGPTSGFVPSAAPSPSVRLCQEADRSVLQAIARASFAGFFGHYHADPRLDPAAATEGYVQWASSALADASSVVLVSETDGRLSGFLTAKKLDGKTWEILLNGVAPEFQRRGIYAALFREIGCRARAQGASELLVSTQLANLAPQKVWTRAGLALDHALYTFHWWKA